MTEEMAVSLKEWKAKSLEDLDKLSDEYILTRRSEGVSYVIHLAHNT